jgi:exopolysaccharide biosynthesis protein
LLVDEKAICKLPETSLVINKHPRTATGASSTRKAVLLTVDGRSSEADGIILKQLAEFMVLLRCSDAVNPDGGGSTTMRISGKPFNGVVYMPSDNRKFDHEGERVVSDIIIVK